MTDMEDKNKKNKRIKAHILTMLLIVLWGFDYVPAKLAMGVLTPSALVFSKYLIGVLTMIVIKIVTRNKNLIRVKDIPLFIACAIFGQILYYECEYNAMNYMPVALITILLCFLPAVSILSERIIYKRKANKKIYIGIFVCIVGVILVIGADFGIIFQGRGLGYLLAAGAIMCWNIYNFITASLEDYDSVTLTATQMLCAVLMLIPIAVPTMPPVWEIEPKVIIGLLWMGVVDSGFGYLIQVYSIKNLGPTAIALYSNFLPITTAFFGVVFLGETITLLQIFGGIIVIVAGYLVIKEKSELDTQTYINQID